MEWQMTFPPNQSDSHQRQVKIKQYGEHRLELRVPGKGGDSLVRLDHVGARLLASALSTMAERITDDHVG